MENSVELIGRQKARESSNVRNTEVQVARQISWACD